MNRTSALIVTLGAALIPAAGALAAPVVFFDETFQNGASIGSGVTLNTTVNPTGTATPGYASATSLTNSISAFTTSTVLSGGNLSGLGTLEFMLFFQPDASQSSQLRVIVQLNQSNNPSNVDGLNFPQMTFGATTGAVLVDGVVPTGNTTRIDLPANQWARVTLDLSAISPDDFNPTYDLINALRIQGNGQTGTFFVDNVTAIPEPSTLGLLGLSGLLMLRRRTA
jgi:hypothetical protein